MEAEDCPICKHQLQAQIEAEFISQSKTVFDIIALLGKDAIDEEGVLAHFNRHPSAVENAAEEKERRRRLIEIQSGPADPPVIIPTGAVEDNTLVVLVGMQDVLTRKFNEIMLTKQTVGLTQIAKEIRETMKEIERVKKKRKTSMADRSDELLAEHRSMNRFLLHNLCSECTAKYKDFLKQSIYAGE